eukprot:SAG31_NODE_81_length_27131_cov_4.775283_19_plen_115_part_00
MVAAQLALHFLRMQRAQVSVRRSRQLGPNNLVHWAEQIGNLGILVSHSSSSRHSDLPTHAHLAPYLANPLGNHHFSWSRRAHDTEARPSTRRNSVPPSVHATIGAASGTGLRLF